jgi:uncharacterized protein YmfQ (DUF2313 family)
MMSCAPKGLGFFCPTKWDLFGQIRGLLPHGRAWQNHDQAQAFVTSAETSQYGQYEVGSTGLGAEIAVPALTILEQYWAAFAEVLEFMHQRACALLDEMFCQTVDETLPEWFYEWGFPDPCLPYTALCQKTIAIGGATCAYLQDVAWSRGWLITCSSTHNEILVTIDAEGSPAYGGPPRPNRAGRMISGCNSCADAGAADLICLIERIKPAHVLAEYEIPV